MNDQANQSITQSPSKGSSRLIVHVYYRLKKKIIIKHFDMQNTLNTAHYCIIIVPVMVRADELILQMMGHVHVMHQT